MDAGNITTARPGLAAEARATLALSGPIVLTNLSQMALALTEALLLGRLGRAITVGQTVTRPP